MAEFVMNLPQEYGWVLLCAAIMGFACILSGFIFAHGARSKVFTEQFMKENFGDQYKKMTGQDIAKDGYPDTGSGYYSRKLSYEQWYTLNNGQRAHMNFVQWIATCEVLLLISGLYFPIPAAAIGLGIIISRFVYGCGYVSGGPKSRTIGAIINDLLCLAQFVLAIISSILFIMGTD